MGENFSACPNKLTKLSDTSRVHFPDSGVMAASWANQKAIYVLS